MDIFMSGDGQSIPFGTNWIHKSRRRFTSGENYVCFCD